MKISNLVKRARHRLTILASLAVIVGVLPVVAQALPFSAISQVYFFGDSLTDSGFNNFITVGVPGKAPTFTTYGGYTWAQYVARDIQGFVLPTLYPAPVAGPDTITNNTTPTNGPNGGAVDPVLTGVDYACGGSTTNSTTGYGIPWAPSLNQQVTQFLSTSPSALDPNAVYFLWSGANDIFTTLAQVPAPTQVQLLMTVNTAAMNIANEVARLSARGAKRFVVISLPSLGSTPFAAQLAILDPTIPATLKNLSFTFDSMINTQLGKIIKARGVKVLYVDVYTLLDNVIAATMAGQPYVIAGNSFKFVNYNTPACGAAPGASLTCASTAPRNYVFADNVHPSDMAHRIISLQVEGLIQKWA